MFENGTLDADAAASCISANVLRLRKTFQARGQLAARGEAGALHDIAGNECDHISLMSPYN